jgi:hypothetical protein
VVAFLFIQSSSQRYFNTGVTIIKINNNNNNNNNTNNNNIIIIRIF